MKKKQLRILVAPLDWGMGHLTRCVPLISHIIALGHQVVFAGDETQRQYVQKTFPELETVYLEGYNVQYSRSRYGLMPRLIGQIPRLKKCIKREHFWLQEIVKLHGIDAVISDNRYGLYHQSIPCVIMTHQLQVLSGLNAYVDRLLRKVHYRFLEKFSACWVVDIPEDNGLSGLLAHPAQLPSLTVRYLGLLSQLKRQPHPQAQEDSIVLILLSGTEPQRSMLAAQLWSKAIKSDRHIIFVEGSEQAQEPSLIPDHISYHKRLNAHELDLALAEASLVICRSGYSTIMDLFALGKKAILIPTPGQTEQEYLAKILHKKKIFMAASQYKFDIHTSLLNAAVFPFRTIDYGDAFERYKGVLADWIKQIQKNV